MINTVEDIAESRKVDRIAGYASASPVIARPIQISGVLLCLYILTLFILCSIVSLVTTSNAQELPAPTSNASILANGWWSPKTVESETAPQLRISMAELTHFETSDLLRTSLLQPASYLTEPKEGSIAGLQGMGLTLNARLAEQASFADPVSVPSNSFRSLLETKYAVWESSLADSRSLTNVNGVSVYPLLQINYGHWDLPVTLYVSPLHDSDAR